MMGEGEVWSVVVAMVGSDSGGGGNGERVVAMVDEVVWW